MRYGILGDIHGNREALEAVLSYLQRNRAARLLCLGDIVGYNADPDDCIAMLRERRVEAVAGNHDLIGLGKIGAGRCSSGVEYSLRRTRSVLSPENAAWLSALPPQRLVDGQILLVHGGVRDVEQALATPGHIELNAQFLAEDFPTAKVCFFGHTHEQ